MADKYVTTKYGTKINVSGLSPDQVKKVLSVAQDNGAYGSKGAALARTFQSQGGKTTSTNPLGVDPNTGKIDPNKATGTVIDATKGDTTKNFQLNNPGVQVDAFGNRQEITRDPVTGEVSVKQTGGAGLNAANSAFLGALGDFTQNGQSLRSNAQNAAYGYITQNYATQKQQEIDKAKQELTNQGIPVDPNPGSLWGRTLAQIDQKYQSLDDQAKNQAIGAGNTIYQTNVDALGSLGSTAQGQAGKFTPYAGATSNEGSAYQNLLSIMSDADLKKYGIDRAAVKGGAAANSGPFFAGSAV